MILVCVSTVFTHIKIRDKLRDYGKYTSQIRSKQLLTFLAIGLLLYDTISSIYYPLLFEGKDIDWSFPDLSGDEITQIYTFWTIALYVLIAIIFPIIAFIMSGSFRDVIVFDKKYNTEFQEKFGIHQEYIERSTTPTSTKENTEFQKLWVENNNYAIIGYIIIILIDIYGIGSIISSIS